MSNYEEIKKLVENSRKIFSNLNEESKNEIRGKYSLLTEQIVDVSDLNHNVTTIYSSDERVIIIVYPTIPLP